MKTRIEGLAAGLFALGCGLVGCQGSDAVGVAQTEQGAHATPKDDKTQISLIKVKTELGTEAVVLVTRGHGYRLECPDDLEGLNKLVVGTGFDMNYWNMIPVYQGWNDPVVAATGALKNPPLNCLAGKITGTRLLLVDRPGDRRYYLAMDGYEDGTRPILYNLGCQGLLDGMGLQLKDAIRLPLDEATLGWLIANDDAYDIHCFKGRVPGRQAIVWKEIKNTSQSDLLPGKAILPITTRAELADDPAVKVEYTWKTISGDCSFLTQVEHTFLGTAPKNASCVAQVTAAVKNADADVTYQTLVLKGQTLFATDVAIPMNWCSSLWCKVLVGDFNSDGRSDLLCHQLGNGYKWITYATAAGKFEKTDWELNMDWCWGAGEVLVGDFNADGRSDLICRQLDSGYLWVALADAAGKFKSTTWEGDAKFCTDAGTTVLVGDFNGDKRSDLLCHNTYTGRNEIRLGQGSGAVQLSAWIAPFEWCTGISGQLEVGDFNKDGISDLLCHEKVNGYKWVGLMGAYGNWKGTTWESNLGWCTTTDGDFRVGDFDGDGRSDLLCRNTSSGVLWALYADAKGQFGAEGWSDSGCVCAGTSKQLFLGDFNKDGRTDLLCHDTISGSKSICWARVTK